LQIFDMQTEEQRKEKILDSLFAHCKLITNTARDVLESLLMDLKVYPPCETKEKCFDVVKAYKKTRSNLEATVDELHRLLYPPPVEAPKQPQPDMDKDNWESY